MIPIKWNESTNLWEITTINDTNWYDYSNGIFANVMLSDGYYKSELQIGITKEQLAENNVGVGVPDDPEHMGTIFTWIPRFAYSDDGDILFLKNNGVLEYNYTVENCFNLLGYGTNQLDLACTGIWIGQKEFESETELEEKNTEMNDENNIQGLIFNEKVLSIGDSEKTAIETLIAKYENKNNTMVQNTDTMQFRQTIKIINTNMKVPIIPKHIMVKDGIKADTKYSENEIVYVLDGNGNTLERNTMPIDDEETQYIFYFVDSVGNIKKYKVNYGIGRPDINSFNINNTFYVVYDKNGNEDSSRPIGESEPTDWYNYEEQWWANIVVRDNGQENYYVWIPRYEYKLDQENECSSVQFISKKQTKADSGYEIPEAFSWNETPISGYWIGKYKLRDGESKSPNISGLGGTIEVNGISSKTDSYTYEMYLIRNGKRIIKDANNKYIDGSIPIDLKQESDENNNYKFTDLEAGKYTVNIIVKDSDGKHVKGITKEVEVLDKVKANIPDLSKIKYYNDITYYVTYDEFGKETSNIPLGEKLPNEIEGWYDYDNNKKATIVIRDSSNETYYEWIPKYQYKTDDSSHIMYISTEQLEANEGYTIPEEFSIEGQEAGYWKEKYKYSNRLLATIKNIDNKIVVNNIVTSVQNATYEISLIQAGKRIEPQVHAVVDGTHTFDNLEKEKLYTIHLVAKDENENVIGGYTRQMKLVDIVVDTNNFYPNNTFYVVYDEDGNEDSSIPINESDNYPDNWYNYTEQLWANIVVRDKGQENYFVWIPRYEYKLNSTNEEANVVFISTAQTEPDEGYEIPEAFKWNETPIPGYWIGKYKLRDADEAVATKIFGLGGKIEIEGIASQSDNYMYEVYLIKDGHRIVWNEGNNQYEYGTTPVNLKDEMDENGKYKFINLEPGIYTVNIIVKDENGKHVKGIANEVEVLDKVKENAPDLSKLDYINNLTYYVVYSDLGEDSNIPVEEKKQEEIEKWYNYDENKKATVVIRELGKETYYEWIPRYQCKIDDPNHIMYISTEQTDADKGYTIPEEFSVEGQEDGYWKEKQKFTNRLIVDIKTINKEIHVNNLIFNGQTGIIYNMYLLKDGKIQESQTLIIGQSYTFNITNEGKYAVHVEVINTLTGTIAGYAKEVYIANQEAPDVTGFNKNNTYYVTYDEEGNETLTSIAQSAPSNWYNYAEQNWANIVVKDETLETENYFVWIPRYEYKLDEESESVIAMLIPSTKTDADKDYKIPDAFTWNGTPIPGYWIGKYKLREK